jgi:hypothetical protein
LKSIPVLFEARWTAFSTSADTRWPAIVMTVGLGTVGAAAFEFTAIGKNFPPVPSNPRDFQRIRSTIRKEPPSLPGRLRPFFDIFSGRWPG